ncbi:MAG: ferrochelatase, partial [Planctomycetota bacterium JB042]
MKAVRRHLDHRADDAPPGPAERGVVLLHVGGPDTEDAIEAFHLALWSDPAFAPRTLSSPFPRRRAEKEWAARGDELRKRYGLIGGRSPVRDLLESQALALENRLLGRPVMASRSSGPVRVVVGTVHGAPTMDEAAATLAATGCRRVAVLPMYVHDDPSTTGRVVEAFERAWSTAGRPAPFAAARGVSGDPAFVEAMIGRVRRSIDLVPKDLRDDAFLLFTMHSPPESKVPRALMKEVEATAQAIMTAVGYGEDRAAVAFQSLGAPASILSPEVEEFAVERAKDGEQALIVAPLSFVTDAFETLQDLDIRVYQAAVEAGVKQYRRVPTLNADPAFIDLLA